ncbi:MAG: phosphohydrolase, partial [Methylococcales bacterium]|nr:phosphohydrolase [Methylococcales bacterium]
KGQTHHEATKILLDVSGSHLDTKLVGKFIKSLGAYPPGSFVELNNGSVALVLEVNNQFKLWPKVLLILDEDKNPVDTTILDLSEMLEGSADSGSMLSIRAIIKPADYQIDSEKYYRQDVIQKSFTN